MTKEISAFAEPAEQQFEMYRSVSKAAVLSLLIGFLSLISLVVLGFVVLSIIAMLLGTLGLLAVRKYPDELAGSSVACAGIMVGTFSLVAAISWHTYVYMTEVPLGFTRLTFSDLQPDKGVPDRLISATAEHLDGQNVFIKGYVHPGVSGRQNILHFVLVGDMKTCCFGGQPKLTDMVEVTLKGKVGTYYSMTRRKLTGVLRVSNNLKTIGGIQGGPYKLMDASIK